MPRCEIPSNGTTHGPAPRKRGGVSRGRLFLGYGPLGSFFAHQAVLLLLLFLSIVVLPHAFAQHGGGSHPAPRAQAPHMPAPRMQSAPHPAYRAQPYGRPAYGPRPQMPPAYRGGSPAYGARPMPYPGAPNRYAAPVGPRPVYGPGAPYASAPRGPYAAPPSNVRGPHLGSWLQNHQGSLSSQENALRQEPGFNRLPPQQQQRLVDRLHQLDAMSPEQRQRTISRNENMERLSPQRRQAVRSSVQEFNTMDPGRKQQVRAAYRVLRDMPPAQRDHVLNSPAYRSMYSDHEREMLGNLLSVEPYTPH